MNAYNPLASMKRLEAAGLERRHAEAIADELRESTGDLVTRGDLDEALESALNKHTVRLGVMISAIIAVACSIMGVIFAA